MDSEASKESEVHLIFRDSLMKATGAFLVGQVQARTHTHDKMLQESSQAMHNQPHDSV